ncbi:MAG: peptide-methionine (R)-S-oxide reductase MsrB [SAR324 cluster bacterium]|nr:peptide-methionine (R)-S-oxide reductase MsrB [SAR324 cluster bacterium]
MEKVIKSEKEWRNQLTSEEFYVCRQKGTERAFTGTYNQYKKPGIYVCRCCGQLLFDANDKFDSGTGWPSFTQPIHPEVVATEVDRSHFMVRTEVLCARCDAHLGHVFEDGPAPTGLRFCMNSISLQHQPPQPDETE